MILQKILSRQLSRPNGLFGVFTGLMMHRANGEMYQKVVSDTPFRDGDKILEIGFGSGKHIKDLIKVSSNLSYAGIDISETMVSYSTRYNIDLIRDKSVQLIKAGISEIPYDDNYFNRIITINTIYFWEDKKKAIKEIIRVLKPGGTISIGANSKDEMIKQGYRSAYFNFWTREEIEELLTENGLNIISSNYYKLRFEDCNSLIALKIK